MSWTPVDLVALTDEPAAEPTLAGVVYPGGTRHLFSGEPESGKTLAAFALGLEEIRTGGRVLHIDFEMFAPRTRERLREMGATDVELAAWIHVEPDAAPTDAEMKSIVALEPTLAIIDAAAGAYTAFGLDDNARKDVETYARLLIDPLAKARISSITIDHVGKSKETRGRFAIGSERKVGGADVHLSFEAIRALHRGGTGLVRITVAKDRFGYLPRPNACDLQLHSDPETHAIGWTFSAPTAHDQASGDWRPTVLMERITEFLRHQHEPVTRNSVFDGVHGKREYLKQALDFLVLDGVANERPGAKRAKLVALDELFPITEQPLVIPDSL